MSTTSDRDDLLAWLRGRAPDASVATTAGFLVDAIEALGVRDEYHFPVCNCGLPWPHDEEP